MQPFDYDLPNLKGPEKVERLRKRLKAKYQYSLKKFGVIAGYEMPALQHPLPQLLALLGREGAAFVSVEAGI